MCRNHNFKAKRRSRLLWILLFSSLNNLGKLEVTEWRNLQQWELLTGRIRSGRNDFWMDCWRDWLHICRKKEITKDTVIFIKSSGCNGAAKRWGVTCSLDLSVMNFKPQAQWTEEKFLLCLLCHIKWSFPAGNMNPESALKWLSRRRRTRKFRLRWKNMKWRFAANIRKSSRSGHKQPLIERKQPRRNFWKYDKSLPFRVLMFSCTLISLQSDSFWNTLDSGLRFLGLDSRKWFPSLYFCQEKATQTICFNGRKRGTHRFHECAFSRSLFDYSFSFFVFLSLSAQESRETKNSLSLLCLLWGLCFHKIENIAKGPFALVCGT